MKDNVDSSRLEAECGAGALFATIWEAMADVLGTAATAALLRRSIKRSKAQAPELDGVVIRREGFEYSFELPEYWTGGTEEQLLALRSLARELSPLLIELTGPVVVRRLNALSQLQRCGIHFQERVDE